MILHVEALALPRDSAILAPADLALFLDFDGTLIDFAPLPTMVVVPPDLPTLLSNLERTLGGALAILTGRNIAELDMLLSPTRLRASGLHGAETRIAAGHPRSPAVSLPPSVSQRVQELLREFPGTVLEDKGPSVAVHFRAVPELELELHAALERFLLRAGTPRLELLSGELVFELKMPGYDKGGALTSFMRAAPFLGRRPVFISDHPIDAAGFAAATALGGFGASVGRALPGVAGWFSSPASLRSWLRQIT
jgi:trehalose 6-phosphate phosphatase